MNSLSSPRYEIVTTRNGNTVIDNQTALYLHKIVVVQRLNEQDAEIKRLTAELADLNAIVSSTLRRTHQLEDEIESLKEQAT